MIQVEVRDKVIEEIKISWKIQTGVLKRKFIRYLTNCLKLLNKGIKFNFMFYASVDYLSLTRKRHKYFLFHNNDVYELIFDTKCEDFEFIVDSKGIYIDKNDYIELRKITDDKEKNEWIIKLSLFEEPHLYIIPPTHEINLFDDLVKIELLYGVKQLCKLNSLCCVIDNLMKKNDIVIKDFIIKNMNVVITRKFYGYANLIKIDINNLDDRMINKIINCSSEFIKDIMIAIKCKNLYLSDDYLMKYINPKLPQIKRYFSKIKLLNILLNLR